MENRIRVLTNIKKESKQPELFAGKLIEVQVSLLPLLLDNKETMNALKKPQIVLHKAKELTTRLSPFFLSSFFSKWRPLAATLQLYWQQRLLDAALTSHL